MTLFGMSLQIWLGLIVFWGATIYGAWCIGFLSGEAQGNRNMHEAARLANGMDDYKPKVAK